MDLSTQLVDPFVTLWFLLMHPLVGLMFAFFLLGTLLMLVYLHKLSNSAHIFLVILLRLSVWIMLVNFLLQLFMTIACPWGIEVQYPVAQTHTHNGLVESLIKHLQWIARPLLLRTKLPLSAWGHALLHAGNLICLRPIGDHDFSPSQIVSGSQPNISHLRVFGCAVYVPIPPKPRSKMGPQRRLGIYVGFLSASIIHYLKPLTGIFLLPVLQIVILMNLFSSH